MSEVNTKAKYDVEYAENQTQAYSFRRPERKI